MCGCLWANVTKPNLLQAARQSGVAVAPGAPFCIGDTSHEAAVRICLGGVSETELLQGLTKIRQLFLMQREPSLQEM